MATRVGRHVEIVWICVLVGCVKIILHFLPVATHGHLHYLYLIIKTVTFLYSSVGFFDSYVFRPSFVRASDRYKNCVDPIAICFLYSIGTILSFVGQLARPLHTP